MFLGGGAGSALRYAISLAISGRYPSTFPLPTFLINVTGSFVIGFIMAFLSIHADIHPGWRLLLVVGVLGGYTTFSSFEYETLQAVRNGFLWVAVGNLVGSTALGFIGVWMGTAAGTRIGSH